MARKDIHLSISLDARTAEMLDELKAMQGISHAEAVRRSIHLLHAVCKVGKPRQSTKVS